MDLTAGPNVHNDVSVEPVKPVETCSLSAIHMGLACDVILVLTERLEGKHDYMIRICLTSNERCSHLVESGGIADPDGEVLHWQAHRLSSQSLPKEVSHC